MKKVLLKEPMPFSFKGNWQYYKEGDVFEVLEEKTLPQIGKCYRVAFMGCELEGWTRINAFKEGKP